MCELDGESVTHLVHAVVDGCRHLVDLHLPEACLESAEESSRPSLSSNSTEEYEALLPIRGGLPFLRTFSLDGGANSTRGMYPLRLGRAVETLDALLLGMPLLRVLHLDLAHNQFAGRLLSRDPPRLRDPCVLRASDSCITRGSGSTGDSTRHHRGAGC